MLFITKYIIIFPFGLGHCYQRWYVSPCLSTIVFTCVHYFSTIAYRSEHKLLSLLQLYHFQCFPFVSSHNVSRVNIIRNYFMAFCAMLSLIRIRIRPCWALLRANDSQLPLARLVFVIQRERLRCVRRVSQAATSSAHTIEYKLMKIRHHIPIFRISSVSML